MNELQIFNNAEFGNIRMVEIDGKPYAVGVDVARALEYSSPSKAVIDHCKGITKLGIPSKGGVQETNVITEGDIVRLITKAADQSKNETIRAKAEKFESWIFDEVIPQVLHTGQYKTEKPKTHAKNRMLKTAIKDLAGTTEAIEKMFRVKKGIAIATAMDMVGREYGIDLEPLRSLLPSEEKPGFLTATEIGEMVGGMSAQKVNKKLNELGLQEKVGSEWRLTAKGKEFGEEIPYTNHGHSGYRPMWCQEIVSEIKDA